MYANRAELDSARTSEKPLASRKPLASVPVIA
jgi:hypothetical protein